MNKKIIVLYSGGLDSTTVLAMAIRQKHEVLALTVDYGQTNAAELLCCRKLAHYWKFPHEVIKLNLIGKDPTKQIPARNTIFLSYALQYAISLGFDEVWYGAEPDSTYTDSSVEYIRAMRAVFDLHKISLWAPIKGLHSKIDVLRTALDCGVPLDLVHSSLTANIDGRDNTSSRFLAAIKELFPQVENPVTVLNTIAHEHTFTNGNPTHLISPWIGSFKFLPAYLLMASSQKMPKEVTVYTTGNWGKAIQKVNEQFIYRFENIEIMPTASVAMLMRNELNTNQGAAQWGTMQMLSRLPRPLYAPAGGIACRQTQGHLAKACEALGYDKVRMALPSDSLAAKQRDQDFLYLLTECED